MKMRTTFCLLVTLFILLISVTTSHAQESPTYMYWTDVQTFKIQRANLDGTNVQDLVATSLIRPDGIALDIAGGKMYWTATAWAPDPPLNKIQRANLDGTDVEDLLVNVGAGEGIAVDSVGRKMYWVNGSDDKIQRANLDGTNIEDLITIGLDAPTGITLDVAGGKMYWTDRGTDKIQRANLDGTNIEDLITTGLMAPINIALDLMDSKMYWTDWEADKIQRANLDGTNIEDLITTGLVGPDGIALHLTTGKMYWADWGTAKIRRANLDGTDIEDLVTTGLIGSAGIALGIPEPIGPLTFNPSEIAHQTFTVGTPVSLTLPIATGGTPPYTYNISALPPGLQFDPVDRWLNGTPTTLVNAHPVTYTATDATSASAALTFTITVQDTPVLTDVYMYWVDFGANKIQRANLDGSNVQDIVTGFGRPVDVTLDIVGGKIYWTDRDRFDHTDPAGRSSINRANLDGTNIETLILSSSSIKEYIALDIAGGKMYWTEWTGTTGKIQRANLAGNPNVEDLVTGLTWEVRGIALDIPQGKMYWGDKDKLQCANLDGSNVQDLLRTVYPRDIALHVGTGKIYWPNWNAGKIQRANLDGSNVEDLVSGLQNPLGIALDSLNGKMYWTDPVKIQRANLDGSNIEDLVTTGLNAPIGIALGIPQTPSLRLNPNFVADQTFTVGTAVSLTLPNATGGAAPYTYTLDPIPAGLQFDTATQNLTGTPTTATPTTPTIYTATDATGSTASLTFTITVELNLDVNGDEKVDVLDLVWVAVSYQMRGPAVPADVNADGVVNVQDLVAVANAIDAAAVLPAKVAEEVALAAEAAAREGAAGAPGMPFSSRSVGMSGLTAHRNVNAAIADAKALGTGDVQFEKWLPLLEELLQVIAEIRAIPETTALLPNYPNPFNPETWIPYHLATEADVTLTIYDVRGVVVRTLRLGQQPVGVYESRGRAAYWDGKNQIGEKVASGLYFYTLSTESTRNSVTAGDFTATRKLLIAK